MRQDLIKRYINMKYFKDQLDSLTKVHTLRCNKKPRKDITFKKISGNEIKNCIRLWLTEMLPTEINLLLTVNTKFPLNVCK